ncbi:unnamed protein product [Peronospora farinosa]|uniref:LAGLIDADG endonuclease n=1 Tax=Peronospora farinosa TaxID=134698 RepID=A0ABN8C6K8_9STRA|nr:unnamed protein product [Peronospora farinosa]
MLLTGKKDVTQILLEVKKWNQESGLGFPIPLLFDKLSKHFTERELAIQLVLVQDKKSVKESVKETANMLADYQMMKWIHKYKYSGEDVFKLLWLEIASIDSPLFDTLISYMVMHDGKVSSYDYRYQLPTEMLRKYYDDDHLFKFFNVFGVEHASKFRTSLNKLRNKENLVWVFEVKGNVLVLGPPRRKDGEVPVLGKRQRNDGEASVPTKGQRIDDDQ